MDWRIGIKGLYNIASLLIFFHKLEMSDDLKYRFFQNGSFVFLVFLDGWYQNEVIGSDIHHHRGLKIYFGIFVNVGGFIDQEDYDLVKWDFVIAYIFMYVFEVG